MSTILDKIDAAMRARAEALPDERACLVQMFRGHERMRELGWQDIGAAPTDGTEFLAVTAGSTGIFPCWHEHDAGFFVVDAGDIWPARPILFRLASREELQQLGGGLRK